MTRQRCLSIQKSRLPNSKSLFQSIYCGIQIRPSGDCPQYCIYIHDGYCGLDYFIGTVCPLKPKAQRNDTVMDQELLSRLESEIIEWLRDYAEHRGCKIMAAGIGVEEGDELQIGAGGRVYLRRTKKLGRLRLPARLWLELDVVPFVHHTTGLSIDERACSAVRKALMYLSTLGNVVRPAVGYHHKVDVDAGFKVHLCDIDDYQMTISCGYWKILNHLATTFRQEKINVAFFNSTPQGGGVALMRHALMRILNLLGVDASWYVTKPNPEAFDITKRKFHNILQGVAPKSVILTPEDKFIYENWCIDMSCRDWADTIFPTLDVAIIDDPQPAGLIPIIKKANPACKIIYRSHIEIRTDLIQDSTSQQSMVWHYLWDKFISQADVFVAHPVANFVPDDVPVEKRYMLPACTDPLDGINKHLSHREMDYYRKLFNRMSFDQTGKRCNFWGRPYIVQISRFDPSKGIPDVIRAYALVRETLDKLLPVSQIPQLIIAGHSSVDDPDGGVVYEEILSMLDEEEFSHISGDVIVTRVPPCDQILNTLTRGAHVALQLSIREGFEIKVTESIIKQTPVVAYATGGIPHQIRHGATGFLVPTGSIHLAANYVIKMFLDKDMYRTLRQNCHSFIMEEYFTAFQTINWLYLILKLHKNELLQIRPLVYETLHNGDTVNIDPKAAQTIQENGMVELQLVESGMKETCHSDFEQHRWERSGGLEAGIWLKQLWKCDPVFQEYLHL